ncbi:MAG: 1-acyl-sn-glycerol-3-phosphate acyltransferase [Clostridia bacterium]|nr:1-acyl-sn-glycerol-3-phosphate acyltransferase [Clostridia bacterium]
MKSGHEKFRYRFVYKAAHLISPFLLRKYSFKTDKMKKTDGNYIVMANHLTEVDMLMVCAAFPEHMYYVAGEHLTRSKTGRRMIWAQNPIFELKGAPAFDTIKEIVKRAKDGNNIMIFPEGSRSFNGETEQLPQNAAKLVKMAGCGLVTYHIEGGYFVAPRWAYTVRYGPMKGTIKHVLTAKQVAEMSREELAKLINEDIYEHAHETQRKNMYAYKGERLAEGIENYLIKCTKCGELDSLASKDNRFWCTKCGLKGIYTEQGFLEGEELRFDNVYDWGKWAEEETEKLVDAQEEGALVFHDGSIKLYEITDAHESIDLLNGEVDGYTDHLQVGDYRFDFKDFYAASMLYYGKTLLFTCNNRHFGITGEQYHAIKYQKLYDGYTKKQAQRRLAAKRQKTLTE